MTSVNTNKGALFASGFAQKSLRDTEASMARLSSGLRVNSGADDAAGLAVSRRMTAQVRSLEMAVSNAVNGISLLKVANSAMTSVTDILQRMREVSIQMGNGTYTDSDRQNAQYELDSLKSEIDRISQHVTFNNVNLLDGSYDTHFQLGLHQQETVSLALATQRSDRLGVREALASEAVDDVSIATRLNSSAPNFGASHSFISKDEGAVSVELEELSFGLQLFAATMDGGEFSLDGQDAAHFSIDRQSGRLSANLDFELLSDTNSDNRFEVTLHYRQGEARISEAITISLMDVRDSYSYITNAGGDDTPIIDIDPASAPLTSNFRRFFTQDEGEGQFSLSGDDVAAGKFEINPLTGVISTRTAEVTAKDVYKFDLNYLSSSGERYSEHVTLTTGYVEPVIDTQSATSAETGMSVTGSTIGYRIEADDLSDRLKAFVALDNDSGSFSIAGTDAAYFQIGSTDGSISGTAITTTAAANGVKFNVLTEEESVFDIIYTNSAGETFTETVTLNSTLGDLPTIQTASRTFSSALETTASIAAMVMEGAVSITSASYSQKLQAFASVKTSGYSYSIDPASTDAGQFSINSNTGALTANLTYASPTDADGNNIYELDILYSDGSTTFTETLYVVVMGMANPFQSFEINATNSATLFPSDLSPEFVNFTNNNLVFYELDSIADPDVSAANLEINSITGEISNTFGNTSPSGSYDFDVTAKIRYSDQWSSGTSFGSVISTNPKWGSGSFQTSLISGGIEAQSSDFAFLAGDDFHTEFWIRPQNIYQDEQIILDFRGALSDNLPVLSLQSESQRLELFQNDSGSPDRFTNSTANPQALIGGTAFDTSVFGYPNYAPGDVVRVHVETTSGNLKIRDISDLTLNTALTGYGGTTTALANGRSEFVGISADELVFEGRLDDVRSAVERIEHTGTAGTIYLTHSIGGTNRIVYNPDNGHFYQEVIGNFEHPEALTGIVGADSLSFSGQTGYLVTVTDQTELDFLNKIRDTSSSHHISGSDASTEAQWEFETGSVSTNKFFTGLSYAGIYSVYAPTNWVSGSGPANSQPTDDYMILTNANLFSDVGSAEKTNYIAEFSDAGGRITSNTQSVASNLLPESFLEQDQWQHIAFSRDGATGTYRVFLDGTEIGSSLYGSFDFASAGSNAKVRFAGNPGRNGDGFIGQMDSILVKNTTQFLGAVPTGAHAYVSGSDNVFLANFEGGYSAAEDVNYTLGLNPTFSPIMTMAGASTLSVKGSEQGYQIDASQLSDNLQGYMNVNPGQSFLLGGADQAYFSIASDGTVAGTTITTSVAGDGNIFNIDGNSSSSFTISDGTFTETVTLNAAVGNETTIQTAQQIYSDPLETTARQIVFRQEGELGWPASDYSEKLRRFAALNQTGFSYALSGDDAGRLTIDTDTGFISAVTDYENAQDADRNQRYEVDVIYSDGTDTFTETITFGITDAISDNLMAVAVPDTETFTLSLDDYNAEFISQALASEAGEFAISGTDSHLFTFNQNTAQISASLPFSPPLDRNSDGVYELAISFENELGQTINQDLLIAPSQNRIINSAFEASAQTTLSAIESGQARIDIELLSESFTAFKNMRPGGQLVLSGQDSRFFSYDEANGVITANDMNFEFMRDANRDGIYEFSVIYQQGSDRFTENISFMVGNDVRDDNAEMTVSRLDLTELGGANEAVDVLDRAIAEISSRQAQLGAVQNRLESAVDNLTSQLLMGKLARGRIVDADFARETSRLIKSQLLGSSAQKVIANAQDTKQLLLSLIR